MMGRRGSTAAARWLLLGSTALSFCASPALAQTSEELAQQMQQLRAELAEQRALIRSQQSLIGQQQQQLQTLQERMSGEEALALLRGAGVQPPRGPAQDPASGGPLPDQPVGEAPPEVNPRTRPQLAAVPEGQGVLTPAGRFVVDPQIEYISSTQNRLVFRGIELIPGIQIGLIEASDVDRDTLIATAAVRYGLTNRLEFEARVPYLYRRDRIEVVQQRDQGIVRQIELEGDGIGDVEFALRYQINRARPLSPIWIAQLRLKTDTGRSPFEIPFDNFGVATGLATGSGFWALQPGISFLLPNDPIVIFGGLSYLYHIPRNIDRTIGNTPVGRVDPGDAIGANIGFGFAVNPRFSFSLGYRHSYIFPTTSELGDVTVRSSRLQVGSLSFGMSYRVSERETVNLGFNFGVTADAPNLSVSLRVPFDFRAPW